MYAVALPTAFHVKVGVALARLPDGATMVAAGGGGVPATVKVIPLLQGPLPEALDVTIPHCPAPGFSVALEAIEHAPAPLAQPACAPVYVVRMRPPELSSTQSMYCVALATAFQLKVGVLLAMLPDGATSVAAPGGGLATPRPVTPRLQLPPSAA